METLEKWLSRKSTNVDAGSVEATKLDLQWAEEIAGFCIRFDWRPAGVSVQIPPKSQGEWEVYLSALARMRRAYLLEQEQQDELTEIYNRRLNRGHDEA